MDGSKEDDVVQTKKQKWIAKNLKASQNAVYLGKALGMAIGGVKGGDLGAIVSADKRILDGHHRWAATMFNDPNAKIGGIEARLRIGDLVPVLRALGDVFGNKRRGAPGGGDKNIFDAKLAYGQQHFLMCFLLQLLFHTLHLVILAFLSRRVQFHKGKTFKLV